MRPMRIANFSGFFGDRSTAFAEMLESAEADVLTGDYLAEVTMSILSKLRDRDPQMGYASTFLAQLRGSLDAFVHADSRVVVNAGGLNAEGLAAAIREMASAVGHDLTVAAVSGDDLSERVDELALVDHDDDFDAATANAYLGGWGIAQALEGGARIVVCGRVADASLVVGPAAWWHGWGRDDWHELAGAVVAGHLIECGTQVTGGNFSGFLDSKIIDLSFPVAEISADGACDVSKPKASGGLVSVDTVTAQLVYEVQGRWYANPDVVADLASVQLEQVAPDVVRVSGVRGAAPPPTTKVAMTGPGGWQNSMFLGVTGMDFQAKADVLEEGLRRALSSVEGIEEMRVELFGTEAADPRTQNEATGFLRLIAHGPNEKAVGRAFSGAVVELALATYPGVFMTAPPGRATAYGAYRSAYVQQEQVQHVMTDGTGHVTSIAPPAITKEFVDGFDPDDGATTVPPGIEGGTVSIRLGDLVHTRSGDKGGNANLGVWVKDRDHWPWLQAWLTVTRARDLMPELAGLDIARVELPHLGAVNFVVRDLLEGGAISSMRLDSQAKALGEFVRALTVDVPSSLVLDANEQQNS